MEEKRRGKLSHLKQMVEEQERELERAVISRGKFQFRTEFCLLEVQ